MTRTALLKANYDAVQRMLARASRKGDAKAVAEHKLKLAMLEAALKDAAK